MRKTRETDAQNRQRAIELLKTAKERETKKKLSPLHLKDKDNTIIMVPQKLSQRQRDKLREKKLAYLRKKEAAVKIDDAPYI